MKSLKELLVILEKFLQDNADKKDVLKNINEEFLRKRLNMRIPIQLVNGMELTSLKKIELIGVVEALYNTGYTKFNPSNYFSDIEINKYNNYIGEKEKEVDIIEFDNVTIKPSGDGFFIPYVPISYIHDLVEDRLISYNFETQRNAKIKKIGEGFIKQINVNKRSVEEIKDLYLNNNAFVTTITLNLTGSEEDGGINYDKENRKLYIKLGSDMTLDCIDGWHRLSGITKAIEEAKLKEVSLEGYINISIETFTVEDARNFIYLNEKKNNIDKDFTKTLNNDDYNVYAKEINKFGNGTNNLLYNNIAIDYATHKVRKSRTTQYVIADALRDSKYDVSILRRKKDITRVVENINFICEYIKAYKYGDNKEAFDKSIYNSNYMYYIYIVVSKDKTLEEDEKIAETLIDNEEKLSILGLNTKRCSYKTINEVIKELF